MKTIETSRSCISNIAEAHFLQYLMQYCRHGLVPSLIIGVAAFGAGELLLGDNKKGNSLKDTDISLYEVLKTAKAQNDEILKMIPKIEDEGMRKDLNEIYDTVEKILYTVSTKPNKKKKLNNFFDYYLPVTLKILNKYDEIENQRLSSRDGEMFMTRAKNMISEMKEAFKKQLANLYQSDLVDADAELKVLDSMLKADGFDSTEFNIKKDEGEK